MSGFQAWQQACEGFFAPLGLSKEYGPSPFRNHTPLQTGEGTREPRPQPLSLGWKLKS